VAVGGCRGNKRDVGSAQVKVPRKLESTQNWWGRRLSQNSKKVETHLQGEADKLFRVE